MSNSDLFVKKQTFEEKWKAKAALLLLVLLLKTNCPEFSCNNLHVWKISLFCTPRAAASASASCPASDGDQIKVKKGVVMGHPPLFNFWVPISEQEEVIFVGSSRYYVAWRYAYFGMVGVALVQCSDY